MTKCVLRKISRKWYETGDLFCCVWVCERDGVGEGEIEEEGEEKGEGGVEVLAIFILFCLEHTILPQLPKC